LLALVRHVTDVERTWFRRRFGAEAIESVYWRPDRPDAASEEAEAEGAERDIAGLVAEWQAARRAVADLPLEHGFVSDRCRPMQLRWAYCHPTSEYDRHNGHADLLRERIDGTTGYRSVANALICRCQLAREGHRPQPARPAVGPGQSRIIWNRSVTDQSESDIRPAVSVSGPT
jgi:hypothetical protein